MTVRKARAQYFDRGTEIKPGDLYMEFKYFRADMFYDWARGFTSYNTVYGAPAIHRVSESECQLDPVLVEMFEEYRKKYLISH